MASRNAFYPDKSNQACEGVQEATIIEPSTIVEYCDSKETTLNGQDSERKFSVVALTTILLSLSVFMVALDRTIISPAIATLTNEFHALQDAGWYGAVNFVTSTAIMPTWGKIFQQFNVKFSFLIALSIFAIGSLISSTSHSSGVFIFGRAISGFGSAGIYPGSLIIITYFVPLHRRASYTGAFAAFSGVAAVVGPILGGAFTSTTTWRWCFYINPPLCAITFGGILFLCQIQGHQTTLTFRTRMKEIDIIGPIMLIACLICLLFALQWGGVRYAWNSLPLIGLVSGSGLIFLTWVYFQYRQGERATIPRRLIFQQSVFFSSLYSLVLNPAFAILVFYLPLYFQAVKGTDAMTSSVNTLPLLLTVTIMAAVGGPLLSIIGYCPPFMILGTVVSSIGIGLLSTIGAGTTFGIWCTYQIIAGLGIGLNLQTPFIAVQAAVEFNDIPVATSITLLFNQIAIPIFLAMANTVILNKLLPRMQALNPNLSQEDINRVGTSGLTGLVENDHVAEVRAAYGISLDSAFYIPTALMVVAVMMALGVEWKSLKRKEKTEEKAEIVVK